MTIPAELADLLAELTLVDMEGGDCSEKVSLTDGVGTSDVIGKGTQDSTLESKGKGGDQSRGNDWK